MVCLQLESLIHQIKQAGMIMNNFTTSFPVGALETITAFGCCHDSSRDDGRGGCVRS